MKSSVSPCVLVNIEENKAICKCSYPVQDVVVVKKLPGDTLVVSTGKKWADDDTIGLVVGLVFGAVSVVGAGIASIIYFVISKRKKKKADERVEMCEMSGQSAGTRYVSDTQSNQCLMQVDTSSHDGVHFV